MWQTTFSCLITAKSSLAVSRAKCREIKKYWRLTLANKLLELRDLHANYGEIVVLKGVNIFVRQGEIVSLIGPNGAGKSTVIKSVFSIAQVTKGEVIFEGKPITHKQTHELLKLGIVYMPQGKVIFSNLTVEENIKISGEILLNAEKLKERIDWVYSLFPVLKRKSRQLAFGLSGGERQMLALARALVISPKLLMLDEPSLGLSPKLQAELFSTISKIRERTKSSILIVEQNAKKAIEISDRTYLLEDGKVVLSGGKEIVKRKEIKAVYLGGRY
ncbi:ABC transporter ATP-binding protein [Candidatus Pacearchaeota archaeon]|nr:MAG: ABC transporter ATP-binding protein [Candidatus Pacearchaeota archaeon]